MKKKIKKKRKPNGKKPRRASGNFSKKGKNLPIITRPVKYYVDFEIIIKNIAKAAKKSETIRIFYPKTDNSKEGWREVEPYSFTTDIGEDGEELLYGKDRIGPGHIFNGYTVGSGDDHCDSFIIGKIKNVSRTLKKFKPRNGWKIEI